MKNRTHISYLLHFCAHLKSSPILQEDKAFEWFVRCRHEQYKGTTKQPDLDPDIINGYFSSSEFCSDFTERGFACACTSQLWSDPGCISLKGSPQLPIVLSASKFSTLLYPSLSVTHIFTFVPEWHPFASYQEIEILKGNKWWKFLSLIPKGSESEQLLRLSWWGTVQQAESYREIIMTIIPLYFKSK